MLLAPTPKASASTSTSASFIPVDETERFSLTQVNNMLLLVDRFMDPKERLLHKVGCKESTVTYFLKKMQLYLKSDLHLFDAVSARAEAVLAKIDNSENLKCEMNHVWARLMKHVFMNGNVLKMNDMRVIAARTLFVQGLKRLLSAALEESVNPTTKKVVVNFNNLDRAAIQMLVSEFLGQLLKTGFSPTVKAIHNFMYLAKKVAKTPESRMLIEQIAVTIAPCLLNALHLNNVLCPLHPKADVLLEMSKENRFLTLVINILLNSNRFDVVFDPAIYAEYHQVAFDSVYSTLMPVLTDPNRIGELVNLDKHLKKLCKVTSEYTSEGLKAALSTKEDEPLKTVNLLMGKMTIDSRPSRNLREELLDQQITPVLFSQSLASPLLSSSSAPPPLVRASETASPDERVSSELKMPSSI